MGQDRLVEPVQYFQRPLYLRGDLTAAARIRNSKFVDDVSDPTVDRIEQFVITMLADKNSLKKLDEGKTPPPPTLELWEPGRMIVQLIDASLEPLLAANEKEKAPTTGGNQLLAAHIRSVERELLLIWRHAIATHNGLYLVDKAKVERLPKNTRMCCVQCRTSLRTQPCPNCRSVYYCGEVCRQFDWNKGHSVICAMMAKKQGLV